MMGSRGGASDTPAPTVEITSDVEATVYEAFDITITFSKPVVGFESGDVTVDNGTLSDFATSDDMVWSATVMPTAAGTVTVDIAAGVCKDAVGNDNEEAAQFSRTCGWAGSSGRAERYPPPGFDDRHSCPTASIHRRWHR